jgi:hypothetical protein
MHEWLLTHAPEWAHRPLAWLLEPTVLGVLAVASGVFFVLSLVGVPWFVARVPADYFSRRERAELGLPAPKSTPLRIAVRVGKNLLGVFLLVAGLAMVVLPGQGLITIVVALLFLDFPGKRRLERRIIGARPVLRAINSLRKRAGQPPIERASLG